MNQKRGLYAMVGTIVLLFAGLIYAWSVLQVPFKEETNSQMCFTTSNLGLTFTICMAFFCLGGLFGGLLQKKINVKVNMLISGVSFFLGFWLASTAESIVTLYIGYGVIAGFASGFVYNGVMSCVTKWYADKPGFISGVLLMGFGIGSFIIGKVYTAVTPMGEGVEEWRTSFFVFGIILVAILVVGALLMKPVPGDYKAPEVKKKETKAKKEECVEMGPAKMLTRPSFWLYIVWTVCLSAVGLILISQASGIVKEISPATAAGTVATVVGLISIANAVGRVICGLLFDGIGRKATMFVVDIVFIIAVALLIGAIMSKSFVLIIISFIVSGLAYGGVTPMNSAFANAFYGAKNYPVNYPIINMNLMIASFGSTLAAAIYTSASSYLAVCYVMLGGAVIATLASILIRRP